MIYNIINLATSYSENEIIQLENKLKFLNSESKDINKSINSLMVIKTSMNGAIGKVKEDKDIRNKRVEVIKSQIEKVKKQFKQECEEYAKQEHEYNLTHQKQIKLEEYYRNTYNYVREKATQCKSPVTKTQFRSISPADNKGETMNITQRIRDEKRIPKNDEKLIPK